MRIVHAVLTQRGIPDFPICGQSGPRFPFRVPARAKSGTGVPCFPVPAESVSRPNRESGERELGISGSQLTCRVYLKVPGSNSYSYSRAYPAEATKPDRSLNQRSISLAGHLAVGGVCLAPHWQPAQ
jgi:hypothetical protein